MIAIKNESKRTNVKDIETKGYGNSIRLCEYDIENDGIKRYCVVNLRDNKVFWADDYDQAKEFFDNYKLKKRPNDVYLGEEAYHIVFGAIDTYGYRYWDSFGDEEIPPDFKSSDGISFRDFRHAEEQFDKGAPNTILRLSKRDKEVLSDVIESYLNYTYDGDISEEARKQIKSAFGDIVY